MTFDELTAKARTALILDQPFFAALLMGMELSASDAVPTAATDGERILINPQWALQKTLPEFTFVLAHEVLHCAFQHMFRLRDRDAHRWNVATDYVINDMLTAEGMHMPSEGLSNPALVQAGGGTADGVYALLPADTPDKPLDQLLEPGTEPGDSAPGDRLPGHGDRPRGGLGRLTEAELSQLEEENKVRVLQARNQAKAAGKLSERLDKLVTQLTKPVVDWRAALRRFLSERAKVDRTFARPKRRFLAEDLILPSLTGEKLGRIVVAVDCSGSINEAQLAEFSAELHGICEDTRPSAVTVVYFDSKVLHTDQYGPDDTVQLRRHGGGGTAFSPIFEHIAALSDAPTACVVFTDLYCDDFGPAPAYPVLWADHTAQHTQTSVPWGEVLPIAAPGGAL